MGEREQAVDTAIILMDAAVQIYKAMGLSKEQAWGEIMSTRPADVVDQVEQQMEFLFDTSWDKVNG